MLNEGILLARGTATVRQGGNPVSWHQLLPRCQTKQPGLRVYLDTGGRICRVEQVNDFSQFRMYEKDRGKSFPVLKLRTIFVSDSVPRKAGALVSFLGFQLEQGSASGWDSDMFKKLRDVLHREALVLEGLLASPSEKGQALLNLCESTRRVDVERFPLELAAWLITEASRGSIDVTKKPFSTLLVRKRSPGKSARGVYAQFEPEGNFPLPAFHEDSLAELNRRLHEVDQESDAKQASGADGALKDAFGGSLEGFRETFPDVALPGNLGRARLFAKAKAANCFRRYSLIEAEAFPVGRKSRQQIKDAFEWAFDQEREGKVWRLLPSGGIGSPLLVCYVDEPQNQATPDLGDFFFGVSAASATAISQSTYEAKAEDLLQTLDGIASRFPDAGVRVFIVTKIGKSRTQIELSQRIAIPALKAAAETWQEGAKNVPIVLLPEPQWTPFPEQVVDSLNTSWIMSSAVSKKVHGFKAGDGVHLLLAGGEDRLVTEALSAHVKNSYQFFTRWREEWRKAEFTDRQRTRRKNEDASDSDRAWHLICRGVPTLGILLFKLKETKDHYMSNTPYQIGQLMALVDDLHFEYCQKARDGEIASQLLGNSMMRIAYDNPQRALQTLYQRLMPYLNWAKTRKDRPWAYWPIRDLGDRLRQASFAIPPSEADRAEILLGYLAKTYQPRAAGPESTKPAQAMTDQTQKETS